MLSNMSSVLLVVEEHSRALNRVARAWRRSFNPIKMDGFL